MALSYNVTALPDYVEQHKSELIGKSVLSAKAADWFTLMTGVKGPTTLNLMTTDVQFGDGSACGWSEAGAATLSQRTLTPAALKVNMGICDKNLLKKYANYLVRVEANKTDRDLPFEQEFTDQVVDSVREKLNEMVWQGTASATSFAGIETILSAEATAIKPTKGANMLATVRAIIAAMPEAVVGKEDFKIFVPFSSYAELVNDLVDANLYHYDPAQALTDRSVIVPGTNIEVVAAPGMSGDYVIAGRQSNFVYGTNLEDGEEIFDLWYSKDNREFRLAIEFVAGVQVAFPDEAAIVAL